MRDEEIMLPGTFEYCERLAQEPDIDFNWFVAGQPIVNAFSREHPYYWVFDDRLDPDQWMRKPPSFAKRLDALNIEQMVSTDRFPPAPGKELFAVIGLRVEESRNRRMGLMSSGGYLTGADRHGGYRKARPIYDWTTADVWRFINSAYDGMVRGGLARHYMRIAPPVLAPASLHQLQLSSRVWPAWFDRLSKRLEGVRTAAQFGIRSITPYRRLGETWEGAFWRTCVETAPGWVAERATKVAGEITRRHQNHATTEFPEITPCSRCPVMGSWKVLAYAMYHGDPFCLKAGKLLPFIEPDFFRPGSGTWGGGKPTW